jgi:hypothetical protein
VLPTIVKVVLPAELVENEANEVGEY